MKFHEKYLKTLILIIISLFEVNCSTYNVDTVFGKYITKGGFEWGSFIRLNKDSTFLYSWYVSGNFNETKGKWITSGNQLIINSERQPKKNTTPNFYLIEKKTNERKAITIDIIDSAKEPLIGADAIMYYKTDTIEKTFSDVEGHIIFHEQPFDSIKIRYISMKNILIHNCKENYLKIMAIEQQEYGYQFFTNESWTIKRKKLIDKTKNEIYYKKIYRKID